MELIHTLDELVAKYGCLYSVDEISYRIIFKKINGDSFTEDEKEHFRLFMKGSSYDAAFAVPRK